MQTEERMSTPDILRAAAAEVRKGWCQGQLIDGRGHVCAIGAIERARSGDVFIVFVHSPSEASIMALAAALPLCPNARSWRPFEAAVNTIGNWNDAPGQTAANVALGLEYAAILSEALASTRTGAACFNGSQGHDVTRREKKAFAVSSSSSVVSSDRVDA